MIRAHRRADGRYRLEYVSPPYPIDQARECIESMRNVPYAEDQDEFGRIIAADDLGKLRHVEKVFGVVTGPSSCGCEPAGFRWVTESEVKAGKTGRKVCDPCSRKWVNERRAAGAIIGRYSDYLASHQCDILEVCGEADEAEAVFQAEFARRLA